MKKQKINVLNKLDNTKVVGEIPFRKIRALSIENSDYKFSLGFDEVSNEDIDRVMSSLSQRELAEISRNYLELNSKEEAVVDFNIEPYKGTLFGDNQEILTFSTRYSINQVPQKNNNVEWFLDGEFIGKKSIVNIERTQIEPNSKSILTAKIDINGDIKSSYIELTNIDESQEATNDRDGENLIVEELNNEENNEPVYQVNIVPETNDFFEGVNPFQILEFTSNLVYDGDIIDEGVQYEWFFENRFLSSSKRVSINRQIMDNSNIEVGSLRCVVIYSGEIYEAQLNINNYRE